MMYKKRLRPFKRKDESMVLAYVVIFAAIIICNSVNSDYVREATDRLNTKIQEHEQER